MSSESSRSAQFLRQLAGVFALLFFMSGADGQNTVQATFLLLTVSCLVGAELWPAVRLHIEAYLMRHPLLDRELNWFAGRWTL